MVYLGSKVKDKSLVNIQEGLRDVLPEGEFIVAIFKASRVKPLVEAIVLTNQRFISVYPGGISQGKGFSHQLGADEITKIELESKKFDGRLEKLFIVHRGGVKEFIANVLKPDHDAILKVFNKMSGSPAPLKVNKQKEVEALSEDRLRDISRRVEKPEKKYQNTCPRCGSDNLQAIQETRTRGVSTVGSTAGCCCLGPIGLLCGLPGAGSSSTKTSRMCLNCGKKF